MTFIKKSNETVTSLSIFVDENIEKIYEKGQNVQLEGEIFRAIYLIIYMLACKQNLFGTNWDTYDDFAMFAAEMVYMRMVNPRQFTTDPGEKKLAVIKSVLNYINVSMNGMKQHYINHAFLLVIDGEVDDRVDPDGIKNSMASKVQADYNFGKEEAVIDVFKESRSIIKEVVYETPYKKDKEFCKNLYLSILLSLNSNLTFPNSVKEKIENAEDYETATALAVKSLKKEEDCIMLWHIGEKYVDFIKLLLRKVKNRLTDKVYKTAADFNLDESVVDDILNSAYVNIEDYNEDIY